MNWWTYVVRVSRTESPKAMAAHTGIDAPNFSKWKNGQLPGPAIVASFARAYGRPVLEAFVEAGFLTAEEAKQRPTAAPSPSSLTDQELVDEISQRLRRRGDHGGDTAANQAPEVGPGEQPTSSTELRAAKALEEVSAATRDYGPGGLVVPADQPASRGRRGKRGAG